MEVSAAPRATVEPVKPPGRSLAIAALTALALVVATAPAEAAWHQRGTTMKPRQQWNANFGYCGETSFIAAGMRHGQYTSQWTARRLASPGTPQWEEDAQLLLGVNDLAAARRMRLLATPFDNRSQRSAREFLGWSKRRFVRGDDVIIGVFNNVRMLGEPLGLADSEYDHIVPLMGFGSATPFGRSLAYRGSDAITFSDNGLYDIGPNTPFLYGYRLDRFTSGRRRASTEGGPLYSLKRRPPNYGVAIRGVADGDGVTAPVRLTSSADGEGRQDGATLKAPPEAAAHPPHRSREAAEEKPGLQRLPLRPLRSGAAARLQRPRRPRGPHLARSSRPFGEVAHHDRGALERDSRLPGRAGVVRLRSVGAVGAGGGAAGRRRRRGEAPPAGPAQLDRLASHRAARARAGVVAEDLPGARAGAEAAARALDVVLMGRRRHRFGKCLAGSGTRQRRIGRRLPQSAGFGLSGQGRLTRTAPEGAIRRMRSARRSRSTRFVPSGQATTSLSIRRSLPSPK